jgi:hypothetical protein
MEDTMSLIQRMLLYCLSDPAYYDAPGQLGDSATRFSWDTGPVPDGWSRERRELWTCLLPDGRELPGQGWKIHVSATPDRAADTLETVALACLDRRVAFKFQRSLAALRFVNGKYMGREAAGKFITVYPRDDREAAELAEDLAAALAGAPGPYILSDLRIGAGPVHVRYGAFTEQWCTDADGARVPALRDPSGTLVPDDRRPVFRVPDWVALPEFVQPHLAARSALSLRGLPYRVIEPLYFTNGGGTYLAEHRQTGQRVVLREARPDAGLDAPGADTVTRLHREHEVLRRLDGLDCVPRAYGLREAGGHTYLVEEYVEGMRLLDAIIFGHPLRFSHATPASLRDYLSWVATIIRGISLALDAIHERGIAFRDLHPANVIVRPDDTVTLIDFEYAGDLDDPRPPRVGAPGFLPPASLTGAAADQYALRAVWLMMLLPMADVIALDPGKRASLEAVARQLFSLPADAGPPRPTGPVCPDGTSDRARRDEARDGEETIAMLFGGAAIAWPEIRRRLICGIAQSATPHRPDRLFPGDPEVFQGLGTSVAHGAAGVLLALHHAGAGIPAGHAEWLLSAVRRESPRAGLLSGTHGAALVLAELGHRDAALEALARCDALGHATTPGLFSGMAGVALAQCELARLTGDAAPLDQAVAASERLDALARGEAGGDLRSPTATGLLHGMAGAALLHLRLHHMTGQERFLAAARRALAHDLARCVTMPDGSVQVKAGHRHFLYMDGGSGGVALAAADYLTVRDDPELAQFTRQVLPYCGAPVVREPGLFRGRSGLLAILARGGCQPLTDAGPAEVRAQVRAQVRRLAWQAVARDGAVLIPGRMLLRFSADLATGSAGVLLALHSVFDGDGDLLALLPGVRDHAPATSAAPAATRAMTAAVGAVA